MAIPYDNKTSVRQPDYTNKDGMIVISGQVIAGRRW